MPSDFRRILCLIALFSLVAVTVFGNVFLISRIVQRGQFERKINVFVISLAIADFCVGIFVMPSSIIHNLTDDLFFRKTLFVKAFFAMDIIFTTSSILHFTCINIDRFVAVRYPLKYFQMMNRKLTTVMIVLGWSTACSISATIVFLSDKGDACSPHYTFSVQGTATIVGSVFVFYIPLALNICASINIYLKVHRRAQELCHVMPNESTVLQRNQQRMESRVIRTIAILQGCFVLCFTPFFLLLVMKNIHALGLEPSRTSLLVVTWIGYVNSTINPYLYYFMNNRLKKPAQENLKTVSTEAVRL
ncbi:D(2) dopamine receptor-like [Ostrea edulis]|uniref:D(2) dopamine receptor-like n=1 Tax=Ostrea edulis TaxID=37623 RepID=UPI0024AF5F3F|nr:D(2) dopamine receptor-like [Ostrea edulis]